MPTIPPISPIPTISIISPVTNSINSIVSKASVRTSVKMAQTQTDDTNSISHPTRHLPDHQSHSFRHKHDNNSDNNYNNDTQAQRSHIYSRHTLLLQKPRHHTKHTQLIMTTILNNNQINNYNSDFNQNKIRNNSNKTKTHYRSKFKHSTYHLQSQHTSKLNAFKGDSPRTLAAARLPRGNNWRIPRCSSAMDPLGSEAPPVQQHYGLLDTPLISKPTITAVPTTTTETTTSVTLSSLQQHSQEENNSTTQNTQTQQQSPQQHTNKDDDNNNNNNNDSTMEPYPQLPSRGSTGQPRSCQQFFDKGNMEKTCGDQKQPTQPPRKRNTNRGIRNPNTIEIRREKRTNKRRVARREKRQEGWGII